MREFDVSDFDDSDEEKEATTKQPEEEIEEEFEPVIIEASRLAPEGAPGESTFAELAAEEIAKQFERRDAEIKIFTSQFKIVGKLLVPAEGTQVRLSDALNAPGRLFLPITHAEITSLTTGKVIQSDTFVAVSRDDVKIVIPIKEPPRPSAKIDFGKETFGEEG